MASCEELLQSIQPGMRLDKAFFLNIYGYEISFPGFARQAIKSLSDAGCSRARQYYDEVVSNYETERRRELKEVAAWFKKECDRKWQERLKEGGAKRKQEITQDLQQMSNSDLILLVESLISES